METVANLDGETTTEVRAETAVGMIDVKLGSFAAAALVRRNLGFGIG